MPYIDCDEARCEEKALTGHDCWHDHWIPDPPETPEEVPMTTVTLTIPAQLYKLLEGEAALCSERYGFTVTPAQILERTVNSAKDLDEFAWDYTEDDEPDADDAPIDLGHETKSRTALDLAVQKYGQIKHPEQAYNRTRQLVDVLEKANVTSVGQLVIALNSGVKIRGIAESSRAALRHWVENAVGVKLRQAS